MGGSQSWIKVFIGKKMNLIKIIRKIGSVFSNSGELC